MSNDHSGLVATHINQYGEEKRLHRTRKGWQMQSNHNTVIRELMRVIGPMIGQRVRSARIKAGLTMEQLGERCGLKLAKPKHRIYEIEKGARGHGITISILYK